MRCCWLLIFFIIAVWAKNETDVTTTDDHCSSKPELSKTILCHYGGWIRPSDLDVCLCSLIVLTDWGLDDDLTLHHPEFGDLNFVSELKRKNDKLKVALLLGASNEDVVLARAASDPIEAGQLAEGVSEFLTQHNLDGIALQWDPVSEDKRDNFTALLQAFRHGLNGNSSENPLLIVSIARTMSHISDGYDFAALDEFVDYFYLPAYNFTNLESHVAMHHSRLMGSDALNADSLLDLVIGLNAPMKKIILGVPMYGLYYHLVEKAVNHEKTPSAKGSVRAVGYQHICKAMEKGNWTVERESDKTAPFAFKRKTWIGYDDAVSIRIKSKYAILRHLAGIGFWRIDQDDYNDTCKGGLFPLLKSAYNIISELTNADQTRIMRSLVDDMELSGAASESVLSTRSTGGSPFRITSIVDKAGEIHVIQDNSQTNMECTRPGYYRNPNDCSHFYRCIKFNQFIDDFTIFEYSCPQGLVFDEKWETCNWPSATSPCGGSSEIFPVPRNKFFCTTEGYFTDPENCRWFYKCSDLQGDGILTAFEFRCPFDLAFDESKIMCEWRWLVPGCGTNGSPHNKPSMGTLSNSGHIPDFRPPRPGHSLTSSSPNKGFSSSFGPSAPVTFPTTGRNTHSNNGNFPTGNYDGQYPDGSPGPNGPFPDGSPGPNGPFPDGSAGPDGPYPDGPSGPDGPYPGGFSGSDGPYPQGSSGPTASGSFDVSRTPHVATDRPQTFRPTHNAGPILPEVDTFDSFTEGINNDVSPGHFGSTNNRFPSGPTLPTRFTDDRGASSGKPFRPLQPTAPIRFTPGFNTDTSSPVRFSDDGLGPNGDFFGSRDPSGFTQQFTNPTPRGNQFDRTRTTPNHFDNTQTNSNVFDRTRTTSSQFDRTRTFSTDFDRTRTSHQFGNTRTNNPFTGTRATVNQFDRTRTSPNQFDGTRTTPNQFEGTRTTDLFTDYETQFWTGSDDPSAFEGREFGDSTEEPLHIPSDLFNTNSVKPPSSRGPQTPIFGEQHFTVTHRPQVFSTSGNLQSQRPFGTTGSQDIVETFPQGPPVTKRPFSESSEVSGNTNIGGRFTSGHQLTSASPNFPKKPLIITHKPKLPPGYIPGHIIGNSQCETSLGVNGNGQNYGNIEIKNPELPYVIPRALNRPTHALRNLRKGSNVAAQNFEELTDRFEDRRRVNDYDSRFEFGSRINRTKGTFRTPHQNLEDYDESVKQSLNTKTVNNEFQTTRSRGFASNDRTLDSGKIIISTSVNAEGDLPMKITISTQASITDDDDYVNSDINEPFSSGKPPSRNIVKHISNSRNDKTKFSTFDQQVTTQRPFLNRDSSSDFRNTHVAVTSNGQSGSVNRATHSHEDLVVVTPESIESEDFGFGHNGEGVFKSKRRKNNGDGAVFDDKSFTRFPQSTQFFSDFPSSAESFSSNNEISTPTSFISQEVITQTFTGSFPPTSPPVKKTVSSTRDFRKPVTGIPIFLGESRENGLDDNGLGFKIGSNDGVPPAGAKTLSSGSLPSRWASLNGTSHVGPVICERAGLFRHPDDCSLFYECYWDKWLNAFTIHFFECPVRLAFDHSILGCNWPFQGPPCHLNTANAERK